MRKWRMSSDVQGSSGVIGPNAILQLLQVLDQSVGPARRAALLAEAGIVNLPDGTCMIPKAQAARLHHCLRHAEPEGARALAARAGIATADYILRHRIPATAQWLLRALPAGPAARFLSRAIARHAWTFVGSGQFKVVAPWTFEIRGNPLIRGDQSEHCICTWHAGVFTRLYQVLVTPDCCCLETSCGAQAPKDPCRFEVRLQR